jgi:predicted DNA-binding transcriptional regulator AlpA
MAGTDGFTTMTRGTVAILTEKELAPWLGVSLPTLQRMRSKGGGPRFVKLSLRRVAYRPSDVEVWLAARTAERICDDAQTAACAQP